MALIRVKNAIAIVIVSINDYRPNYIVDNYLINSDHVVGITFSDTTSLSDHDKKNTPYFEVTPYFMTLSLSNGMDIQLFYKTQQDLDENNISRFMIVEEGQ